MQSDPSRKEGLRTASKSTEKTTSRAGQQTPDREGIGLLWAVVGIALLVGFSVGSQLGTPDPMEGEGTVSEASLPTVSAAVALADAVGSHVQSASESLTGADEADYELAAQGLLAASGGLDPVELNAADRAEIAATLEAAAGTPIEALPVYEYEEAVFLPDDYVEPEEEVTTSTIGTTATAIARAEEDIFDSTYASGAESLTMVTRGAIGKGESLGASLRRQGIAPTTVHLIAKEMRKVFDFRRSRPGDRYLLEQDSSGKLLDFRYSQSEDESYSLSWEGAEYVVRKETTELHPYIAKIAGVVDSSFYGAVVALGEQSALAANFTRILAWDIDFSRNVHAGDEFQILYERLYRRNDEGEDIYVRPGRILAGRYSGRGGDHTVVYFEDEEGHGSYFRPDGSSIERAFLAAPLEFSRITSRFTGARRHPILKITRPHRGIDYAAPQGTPVWSVADGVVEYKARAGASGNLIRIRHQGGLTSHYAHLSKFASNLKVGDPVKQKQVIGFVGSTGLSTGPHVCFRVKQDGNYVDPMKISGPAGDPVQAALLPEFKDVRDRLLADLGASPISFADEAL